MFLIRIFNFLFKSNIRYVIYDKVNKHFVLNDGRKTDGVTIDLLSKKHLKE